MAEKRVIAVVGATGAQGGGLVRAIVSRRDGPFVARAITRRAGSDKARALAALGAEVVQADAESPISTQGRGGRRFRGRRGADQLPDVGVLLGQPALRRQGAAS
jgi:hypothetical protein